MVGDNAYLERNDMVAMPSVIASHSEEKTVDRNSRFQTRAISRQCHDERN